MKKSYPKGPINQHKQLATGQSLRKPNTKNMGGGMNMKGGMGKGGTISSSGTTGGPRGGKVPSSTTVPDKKGPKGHKVPASTMTNY